MNNIAYSLLRLSMLVALVLMPGIAPTADALGPQQTSPFTCQPVFFHGKIKGTVRDSDGQPLQGVQVLAHPTTGAGAHTSLTNAAGEYGISLPPSTYLVEFKPASGHAQGAWYKSGFSPIDATPVEVGDGKTVSGIDIKLAAGGQFNVTLRDPEGKPVEQGLISVFDRYDRKAAEGQTDDQGRALTVPALPLGSYRLWARPPYGSGLLAHYHNQKPTLAAAEPLTITQALGSVDVPMTLQQGAELRGAVTDASTGTPLAGISVEIQNTDGEIRDATTDPQGRYSVAGLASGAYRVEFKSAQPGPGSPALLRRLVTLNAPNAQTGFDAALTPGGAISGRVTTPDGTPIPGVYVKVRDLDGVMEITGTSAADGTYTIHGLPSGGYILVYSHASYQALALAGQVTVTVSNTTSLADTLLRPGGAIAGKVIDPDGQPLQGVYVSILDAASGNMQESSAYTDAAGVYTTTSTLPNGSYVVKFQPQISAGGCPFAIEYSGNAASAAAATPVQISGANTVSGIDAKLDHGGQIGGQLTDAANGLPLYGEVQVYDATGELVVTGFTGSLGHYRTTTGLPPGSYRVQFLATGYVSLFYGGSTAIEAAARVPSGAVDITMALPPGGTLTGRITAANTGAPLEHAAVTLYGSGNRVVSSQLTSFDGVYRFRGSLPSGIYRLGVAAGQREDGTFYFTGYEPVFSGGARSLPQAQSIILAAPQTIGVELAMPLTSDPTPTPATPTPATPTPATPTPATPTPVTDIPSIYLPVVQN